MKIIPYFSAKNYHLMRSPANLFTGFLLLLECQKDIKSRIGDKKYNS